MRVATIRATTAHTVTVQVPAAAVEHATTAVEQTAAIAIQATAPPLRAAAAAVLLPPPPPPPCVPLFVFVIKYGTMIVIT